MYYLHILYAQFFSKIAATYKRGMQALFSEEALKLRDEYSITKHSSTYNYAYTCYNDMNKHAHFDI